MHTTSKSEKVRITTQPAGCHFATVGVVRLRGRVVAVTRPYPYGFNEAALEAARRLAGHHQAAAPGEGQ